MLVHLIDLDPSTGRDPLADYQAIQDELRAYSEELAARPQIVTVNKVELPGTEAARAAVERFCAANGLTFHAISAVTGEGLPALVHEMARRLASEPWVPAHLRRARRIVVKVGSGLVTTPGEGPSSETIARLAGDLAALVHDKREVALVSSGAIATGVARLGLKGRPQSIPEKQAAAAVGQSALMWDYEQAFKKHGIPVGQVLLTGQDISDRSRYLNARNTLLALLDYGVLPVINENDTVAVDEIKVGDNDNLAALVAHLIDADLLVLLTDVDGLYTGDPRRDPGARRLETVEAITDEIQKMVFDASATRVGGRHEHQAGGGAEGGRLRHPHGDRERARGRDPPARCSRASRWGRTSSRGTTASPRASGGSPSRCRPRGGSRLTRARRRP